MPVAFDAAVFRSRCLTCAETDERAIVARCLAWALAGPSWIEI